MGTGFWATVLTITGMEAFLLGVADLSFEQANKKIERRISNPKILLQKGELIFTPPPPPPNLNIRIECLRSMMESILT
jgi:hypothetical protein